MANFLEEIGHTCLLASEEAGRMTLFTGHMLRGLFTTLPRRETLVRLAYSIGVRSIPVVLTTGAFVGMVLALEMHGQLDKLNAETAAGPIINISIIRELAPVLAGVMLAGRIGGAMAAELGTMKVTEQIDALRTVGADPIYYLVVPRFLCCLFLVPVLTIFADFIGVLGGYLVSVLALGVDSHGYWVQTRRAMENWDIFCGILKSAVFGMAIAVVCCYKGFTAGEGAEGVGRATTQAFVFSFIAILVSDFFLAVLLRFIYNTYIA